MDALEVSTVLGGLSVDVADFCWIEFNDYDQICLRHAVFSAAFRLDFHSFACN